MPAQSTDWTAERQRALPDDGQRYEVLDGALFVTPAPSWLHQRALLALADRLRPYVRELRVGEVLVSPADVEFSPRRLVQPDLFVVPDPPSRRPTWRDITSLVLAVEVLSPTTAHADRHRKRLIYQSERVPEYWIVDLDARIVERWQPDDLRPEILAEALVWQPAGTREALSIDLVGFFSEVLD